MLNTLNTIGDPGATNPKKQFIESAASKAYPGPSIVDYLSLSGQPTDFASRQAMGEQYGISGIGTAEGNTALLQRLRSGNYVADTTSTPAAAATPAAATPAAAEPPKTKVDLAFESYLSSLTESPELTEARKSLTEMDTQAALAYEKALEKGETLGFARGEAGLTQRQNAIIRGGQAAVVEAYAELDKQRGNISKARYEYEKAKIDEARDLERESREAGFSLSPGQTRFSPTGDVIASLPATPKATTSTGDKPLSTVDLQRIENLYGFVPPLGVTMSEIEQFVNDNPNATPAELQAGIDAWARGETGETTAGQQGGQFLTKDYFNQLTTEQLKDFADKAGASKWYTGKSKDIDRFLDQLMVQIEQERANGYSDQQILDYMVSSGIISAVE